MFRACCAVEIDKLHANQQPAQYALLLHYRLATHFISEKKVLIIKFSAIYYCKPRICYIQIPVAGHVRYWT